MQNQHPLRTGEKTTVQSPLSPWGRGQGEGTGNSAGVFSPVLPGPADDRSGAAAVELAIILPVLMTIVWGCVDLGRIYHSSYSVVNAARAGAGYAATHTYSGTGTAWRAEIHQVVINEMDQLGGFDPSQVTVTAERDLSDGPVPRLRVTVQYPFATIVNWPLLPSSFQLVHRAEMRAIR